MESVLIPCVKWTKKGYAAKEGKQIEIKQEELQKILKGNYSTSLSLIKSNIISFLL
jgi:hypothetical protein